MAPMDERKKGRKARSNSSQRWLARQRRDPFARQASETGKASRAHFKLEQLDERFRLLKPGQRVLELGAAPGGWTCYVEERIRPAGLLLACDERPITTSGDTVVIDDLYGTEQTDKKIANILGSRPVDLVLSDMAPNISGIRTADQARSMELVELAEAAADDWLKPSGTLVVKIFQGDGIESWIRHMRKKYDKFKLVKPKASRQDSREMYAVAERFRAESFRTGA